MTTVQSIEDESLYPGAVVHFAVTPDQKWTLGEGGVFRQGQYALTADWIKASVTAGAMVVEHRGIPPEPEKEEPFAIAEGVTDPVEDYKVALRTRLHDRLDALLDDLL